jgi:hypothetical protein
MARYNLARNSSLARSSREETEEETAAPTGMSLDQYYISLGKAAKADYERGLITQAAFLARLQTLRTEIATLKGVA